MSYRYEFGGKTWVQRPLVLGQIQQLLTVIRGLQLPIGSGVLELVEALGDRLPVALAIVLVEDGRSTQERFGIRISLEGGALVPEWHQDPCRMGEIATEIFATIDTETIIRVVSDFLSCNPISGLLGQLTGMMTMAAEMVAQTRETGSTGSSASSPEGISPDATASSGDTRPENANPISAAVNAT